MLITKINSWIIDPTYEILDLYYYLQMTMFAVLNQSNLRVKVKHDYRPINVYN